MPPRTWTIKEILGVTSQYLASKEIDSPRLTAELLLADRLDCTRLDLYLRFDQPLKEDEVTGYRELIRRRVRREPVQYILGRQEFWSLDFQVGPGVLIPRPETEILVEEVLEEYRAAWGGSGARRRILDLCTGSGAVAVSLAREIPKALVYACDISEDALRMARDNARRHGVLENIVFFGGDLLGPVKSVPGGFFDMIVSNPPYVTTGEWEVLSPEVRDHEPRIALDGGEDGMRVIRRILMEEAPRFLRPGGGLFLEMDPGQIAPSRALALESGLYEDVTAREDYSRRERVLKARLTRRS